MNLERYRNYCLSLSNATEDLPFDEAVLAFKVAGKIFSLTNLNTFESVTIKCDPELSIDRQELYEAVTAGYHMSKKHWITVQMQADVSDEMLLQWTKESYDLVISKLTKKVREQLKQVS